MLPIPQLDFRRTPVVLVVTALAAAIEAACLVREIGGDHGALRNILYNQNQLGLLSPVWSGELWRPLTTCFLHGDIFHLLFNGYWLLIFGGTLERRFGSWRFALLFVLLAYVSMMPQFVIANYRESELSAQQGVVGLSGILYGLFGILLVGRRRDAELYEVCNDQTALLMAAWFVLCIIMDRFELMRVGNFAHGAGLIFGVLYGGVIFERRFRWLWLTAALLGTLIVFSTLCYVPGHELYQQHQQNVTLRSGGW